MSVDFLEYLRPDREHFMSLALKEGRKALPLCLPNPPVGCVIVSEGLVVATGYTQPPGGHHAEAQALHALGQSCLEKMTAFVTLEPCSFYGRTPSCADAFVELSIGLVYVSILDPDPRNSGAGIAKLERAGICVRVGLLAKAAQSDLKPYLYKMTKAR